MQLQVTSYNILVRSITMYKHKLSINMQKGNQQTYMYKLIFIVFVYVKKYKNPTNWETKKQKNVKKKTKKKQGIQKYQRNVKDCSCIVNK